MLLVDLEKGNEDARETSKSDKETPAGFELFQTFIVVLFFALVAVFVAWFFDLNIKLFVTPYPEDNNNIVKHVATGLANPTMGLVGLFLGVVFVFFCALRRASTGDGVAGLREEGEERRSESASSLSFSVRGFSLSLQYKPYGDDLALTA